MRKGSGKQLHKQYPREYNIWSMMKQRCRNPKAPNYANYGACGVTVSPEFDRFEDFLRIVGPAPTIKHTLDRIDNSMGYSPENCRWADVETQQNNRTNGVHYEYQGQMLSAPQLARIAGIPVARMEHRLREMGLTAYEALALPKQSWVQRPVIQRTLAGEFVQQYDSLVAAADYAFAQKWPRTSRRKDGATRPGELSWDSYKKNLFSAMKASRPAWGYLWAYAEPETSSTSTPPD